MTPEQFQAACNGKRLTAKVRKALRMVLVEGSTWREAAYKTGVHESSIMRAKARLNQVGQSPVINVPPDSSWLPATSYQPAYDGELGSIVCERNGDTIAVYRFVKQQENTQCP